VRWIKDKCLIKNRNKLGSVKSPFSVKKKEGVGRVIPKCQKEPDLEEPLSSGE